MSKDIAIFIFNEKEVPISFKISKTTFSYLTIIKHRLEGFKPSNRLIINDLDSLKKRLPTDEFLNERIPNHLKINYL